MYLCVLCRIAPTFDGKLMNGKRGSGIVTGGRCGCCVVMGGEWAAWEGAARWWVESEWCGKVLWIGGRRFSWCLEWAGYECRMKVGG